MALGRQITQTLPKEKKCFNYLYRIFLLRRVNKSDRRLGYISRGLWLHQSLLDALLSLLNGAKLNVQMVLVLECLLSNKVSKLSRAYQV